MPSVSKTVQSVRKVQHRENTHWDYSQHSEKDQLVAYKGNLEFDVPCVASVVQSSDYFPCLCQKPPGTAKGWEGSVVNVKDNVIENELSRVVGFVS